jgi:hypothetical protein
MDAIPDLQVHILSGVHSDILDARLAGVVQAPDQLQQDALSALIHGTSNRISFESYQNYAVVLDVDGGQAAGTAADAVLRWRHAQSA